jgi:hypothetical protein
MFTGLINPFGRWINAARPARFDPIHGQGTHV